MTWSNRVQNRAVVSSCTPSSAAGGGGGGGTQSWSCASDYQLEEEDGWLDIFQSPVYSDDGERLIQIQTNPTAASDGMHYKHLAEVELATAGEATTRFLTSGRYVVTGVSGWDQQEGIVYYMGTGEGDPVNDPGQGCGRISIYLCTKLV